MNVAPQLVNNSGSNSHDDTRALSSTFARVGYCGPIPLLTQAECDLVTAHFLEGNVPAPADWEKGRAATDRLLYDIATRPDLLALLRRLLGSNVILWGADIIRRKPGQVHHWHTDIESSDPNGRFVSVWIGIENTSRDSSLDLLRHSHKIGKPIQQVANEHGAVRGEASSEAVLAWARKHLSDASIDRLNMSDGDAVIFDGRLWHGSSNTRTEGQRSALLLQYAAADMPIRIPDPSQVNWPFRHFTAPLPPVILICGSDHHGLNRLVPAPAKLTRRPTASTWIRPLDLPLADDPHVGWKPHRLFRGSTRILDELQCHASVLSPGHTPHPPHRHAEEELLVILDGEADIVLADDANETNARVERLRPGAFTYYPPHQFHTIRNAGTAPVTYLMFKWRAGPSDEKSPLDTGIFHYADADGTIPEGPKTHVSSVVFQQPTIYLGRLRAHVTHMRPGGGYDAHTDAYDVAVLVLSGRIETLGQLVEPHGVVFYSAGEPHGIRNVGDEVARYLVFEFRAPGTVAAPKPSKHAVVAKKQGVADRKRPLISTRKLRRLMGRLLGRVDGASR